MDSRRGRSAAEAELESNGRASKRTARGEDAPEPAEAAGAEADGAEAGAPPAAAAAAPKADDEDGNAPGDADEEEEGAKRAPALARRTLRPRGQVAAKPRTGSARSAKAAAAASAGGGAGGSGADAKALMLTYHEGEPLRDLSKHLEKGDATVQVRIPQDCLSIANKQVRNRQLWGTDVYTDDSDLVAVLQHTGFYVPSTASHLAHHVQELHATIRPLPPQDGYTSTSRNSIRSRAWGAARTGCSFKVEKCRLLTTSGGSLELDPTLTRLPAAAPTFVPAHQERVVNTRNSQLNLERRQRFIQEVTMQYNLCNEPWLKYSVSSVADRGLKLSQWTSARLKKEVLYVETHCRRYELADLDPEAEASSAATFQFSLCKQALPLVDLKNAGLPLPADHVEVLTTGLAWEDVKWGPAGVTVGGKLYPIVRLQFLPRTGCEVPLPKQKAAA